MNADFSENNSLIGQHLIQLCENLFFLRKSAVTKGKPISEAWNTMSWLDHCSSTADAHDSRKVSPCLGSQGMKYWWLMEGLLLWYL